MKNRAFLCALCASVVQLCLGSGCASTTVSKTAFDAQGVKTGEMKLSATGFLIKRDLGRIVLDGVGSLDGAKSDQSAVAQLIGEALLARAGK